MNQALCESELCKQFDLYSLTWSSMLWLNHNKNLTQPFYIQEETRSISSNSSHGLKIGMILWDRPYSLLHTCACTHTFLRILMGGCSVLTRAHTFDNHHLYTNANWWARTPSILVNISGTGLRKNTTTFLRVMKCLMRRCCGDGHVKTSMICPH